MTYEEHKLLAFRHIYETNARLLLHFARRFTEPDKAEDIVHDVFMEFWEKEKVWDEKEARYYLFIAVRNRCLNHLRQEQVRNNYIDQAKTDIQILSMEQYESAEQILYENEKLQNIYRHIDQLPEKCREIFKLAHLEEKKSAEIAQMLGLSIRTVEHHLYLGLKTLRNKLKQVQ